LGAHRAGREPHRIRRVEWRARTSSSSEAMALRARLRRFVDTDLLPTLERTFDALAGDDTIHVPRLEISLRVQDVGAIGDALAEAVREQAVTWRRTGRD